MFTEGKVVDNGESRHGYMVTSLMTGECNGTFLTKFLKQVVFLLLGICLSLLCLLTCIFELSWLTNFIFMNFMTASSPLLPCKCSFCSSLYNVKLTLGYNTVFLNYILNFSCLEFAS